MKQSERKTPPMRNKMTGRHGASFADVAQEKGKPRKTANETKALLGSLFIGAVPWSVWMAYVVQKPGWSNTNVGVLVMFMFWAGMFYQWARS